MDCSSAWHKSTCLKATCNVSWELSVLIGSSEDFREDTWYRKKNEISSSFVAFKPLLIASFRPKDIHWHSEDHSKEFQVEASQHGRYLGCLGPSTFAKLCQLKIAWFCGEGRRFVKRRYNLEGIAKAPSYVSTRRYVWMPVQQSQSWKWFIIKWGNQHNRKVFQKSKNTSEKEGLQSFLLLFLHGLVTLKSQSRPKG